MENKKQDLEDKLSEHHKWLTGYGAMAGTRLVINNADLRGISLRYKDLRYSDLSNCDLRDSDLRSTDFSHASLMHADFRGAILDYTNLAGANLNFANLSELNLLNSYLNEISDLSNADLKGSLLTVDFLRFARLDGALLTNFRDASNAR